VLGVLEQDEHGTVVDQYLALIPAQELTIEDTWFTVGMRASGSNCFVADDVFVPNHRLMSIIGAIDGVYPTEHKEESCYRAAFVPVAALILIGPQLGLGRAALSYVLEKAPQRGIPYTAYHKQSDSIAFQLQLAEAALKIDTAHLHAFRAAADIDDAASTNAYLDPKTRARVRADAAYTASQISQAIDILLTAHGAASFAESSPLQRIWRDCNTASRHAIVLPNVCNEVFGKALLGLSTNTVTPLV
jgi:alkylation response protein AidB-like acyl-CoA dehydrogenase